MAERRVFAGYYKRYDGKPIFIVRVLRDIDTGEAIVASCIGLQRTSNSDLVIARRTAATSEIV